MKIDKQEPPPALAFRLDASSGVPTYLQLVRQVEDAVRLGYLAAGDQLPKVKDVVASLAINPNTVLKAYRELEHKGLAAGRPGQGTFVQVTLAAVPSGHQQTVIDGLAAWLGTAAAAGFDEASVSALVARVSHEFFHGSRQAVS